MPSEVSIEPDLSFDGAKHTSTLDTVNNLGILYKSQGKLAEAEKMYERALQGTEEALCAKHTSTRLSMSTGVEYRKLDITINEIRILRLVHAPASASHAPLHCMLEYHPLASPPPYTALSYQWGNKDDTVPILVGGLTFLATRNLENALRCLRVRGNELVWADAICINQNDIAERGEQINRMGAIYQCAESVVAWLGDSTDVQNYVFPLLKRIHDTSPTLARFERPMFSKPTPALQRRIDYGNGSSVKIGANGALFYPEDHDDDFNWQPMAEFFKIPYWKRAWIIQELAFGQDLQLLCGLKSIPFDYLATTVEVFDQYASDLESLEKNTYFDNVRQIKSLRNKIQASKTVSLLEAMVCSATAESSEIKDSLYSLLSLVRSPSLRFPAVEFPALSREHRSKGEPHCCSDILRLLLVTTLSLLPAMGKLRLRRQTFFNMKNGFFHIH